jgi:hypothetical protein
MADDHERGAGFVFHRFHDGLRLVIAANEIPRIPDWRGGPASCIRAGCPFVQIVGFAAWQKSRE